jgi:predicted nucleic acid-binding protein
VSLVYLDSSALLKLLIEEEESAQLTGVINAYLTSDVRLVTSALTRVELNRARIRNDIGGGQPRFDVHSQDAVLDALDIIQITENIVNNASSIPFHVKSLDAIHLATADVLRDDLEVLITFDENMLRVGKLLHLNARVA